MGMSFARLILLGTFLAFGPAAFAQTYTQMTWGVDKTATPYGFGANINGSWYNLGTVSSAGVWTLAPSLLNISGTATFNGTLYAAANVGVGTSSPLAHFQVTNENGFSGFYTDAYDDTGVYHYYSELRNINNQGYGEGFYSSYGRGSYTNPAVTQVLDTLGYLGWGAYSNSTSPQAFNGFDYSTAIAGIVDSTPTGIGTTAAVTPAAIVFMTQGLPVGGTTTTTPYEKMRLSSAGNLGIGTISPATLLTVAGPISIKQPSTVTTSTYTVATTDSSLIFSTNNCTVTMPTASTYPGRVLYVKNISAISVTSAASNIVPLATSTAGTSILSASAGKWAMLQSDGTNWVIMAYN